MGTWSAKSVSSFARAAREGRVGGALRVRPLPGDADAANSALRLRVRAPDDGDESLDAEEIAERVAAMLGVPPEREQ